MEADRDVRLRELQGQPGQAGTEGNVVPEGQGPPRIDTLAARTKMFGDALRHVLPQMPSESADISQFFDTVEKLFHMYEVPDNIKSKLYRHRLKLWLTVCLSRITHSHGSARVL